MKLSVLICVVILTPLISPLLAQKTPDYIVQDTILVTGKVSYLGNGRFEFRKDKREAPLYFTVDEVEEFGNDGEVFEAYTIENEKRYIKRVAYGKAVVYKVDKNYALKDRAGLLFFNSNNYIKILSEEIDCSGAVRQFHRLTYNEAALRNFLGLYNKGICEFERFPYKRFGIYTGISSTIFRASTPRVDDMRGSAVTAALALFADFPNYSHPSVFITTELHLVRAASLLYIENRHFTNSMGAQVTGAILPIGLKWIMPGQKITPYLKPGIVVSYLNIESSTGLIETRLNDASVEITREGISDANYLMAGFQAGAGFETPYRERKNFHLEIKYLKTFRTGVNPLDINVSGIYLITGFNI